MRIPRGEHGHFVTAGRINNRYVEFMVDTGASSIALNSQMAEQLGINYRQGPQVLVETANGRVVAHRVMLSSVAVGDLTMSHVSAFVMEGHHPQVILLGNSYLGRVNVTMNNVELVLTSKY